MVTLPLHVRLADEVERRRLAVRRRHLPAVALIWTMSQGSLTRRLGRFGWLLLPISGPVNLISVAAVRATLVRRRTAVVRLSAMHGPDRVDLLAVLAAGVACLMLWIPLMILPFLLPERPALVLLYGYLLAGAVLALDVVVPSCLRFVLRLMRGAPPLALAPHQGADLHLAGFAAYPRGRGDGAALMREVGAVLDALGATAVLDARTDRLVQWYARFGYEVIACQRMRRRAPTSGPADR